MLLELVVAVAENDVIGRGSGLPWRLSADLRHFKALTLGKPILMGRKTYESIGRALPGRTNIVLTRAAGFAAADCRVAHDLGAALGLAGDAASLMVIGGAEIYRQCLPRAHRIHLTLVHARIEDGDTIFSGWRGLEWRETCRESHGADQQNQFPYSFLTLERTGGTTPAPAARPARPGAPP
jgi:dihydrofolate reductase